MKMKRILIAFIAVLFIFSFEGCGKVSGVNEGKGKKYSSEEIYDLCKDSVVEITSYDKKNSGIALGSGFIIDKAGLIVTNYHVIDEAYSIKVKINSTYFHVVTIWKYDKNIDLAVLKIDADNLKPLTMSYENYTDGSTVYTLGSSEGYTLSFSSGVIASQERVFDGVKYIQHSSPISEGNSGGPLINEYGQVIGINTASNINGQNLNFAIKVEEIERVSDATKLSMYDFYQKEGPYFEMWVGDYTIYEHETNDSMSYAQTVVVNGSTIEGNVNKQYDMDFYKIQLMSGQTLTVFFIPEYAVDATGVLCGLLDSGNNVLATADTFTVGDTRLKEMTYTNRTTSNISLYILLFYDTDYQYKNTVANYSLFIYMK